MIRNTIREVYYKKALPSKCTTMMNKVLFIVYYSKIANTGHHSCIFSVVYNNIQKITNISIKKPIILISILNKYLDIPIYLDNRTPLLWRCFLFQLWVYFKVESKSFLPSPNGQLSCSCIVQSVLTEWWVVLWFAAVSYRTNRWILMVTLCHQLPS